MDTEIMKYLTNKNTQEDAGDDEDAMFIRSLARVVFTPTWAIHRLSLRMYNTTTSQTRSWRGPEELRNCCALWGNSISLEAITLMARGSLSI